MFNIQTIRQKMMLVGITLFAVILIQVVLLHQSVSRTQDGLDEIANVSFNMYKTSRDLQFSIAQVQGWLTDISATRGLDGLDDGYKEADGHAELVRGYLKKLIEIKPEGKTKFQKIEKTFDAYY